MINYFYGKSLFTPLKSFKTQQKLFHIIMHLSDLTRDKYNVIIKIIKLNTFDLIIHITQINFTSVTIESFWRFF